MHMRPFYWGAALFLALPPAIWADTLILKDGQAINGRYLSSDADNVQFEVNGKPFSYAVWLIRELRFSSAAGQPEVRSAGLHGKEQEQAFCQVLRDFQKERQRLTSEPNPIRRAQMQPPDPWTFESRVAAAFGASGEFTDWTGRLFFTVAGSTVSINFAPACPPVSRRSALRTVIQLTTEPGLHKPVSICPLLSPKNSAATKRVLSTVYPDVCSSVRSRIHAAFRRFLRNPTQSIRANASKERSRALSRM